MQTVEQLMQPRVRIKNWYPECLFEVGDILILEEHEWSRGKERSYVLREENGTRNGWCIAADKVEKATANFEPLAWYEYRKNGDLPKYLKFFYDDAHTDLSHIIECKEWNTDRHFPHPTHSGILIIPYAEPATEEEYKIYHNSISQP